MNRFLRNFFLLIIVYPYLCTAVYAFDSASFLEMSEDQQTYYLLGLIDSELLKSSRNGYCVLEWARDDMHMFLSDWYSHTRKHTGEQSIAFIVSEELDKVCSMS